MRFVRVVVDASVWVSRIVPRDVHHEASSLWAAEYTKVGGLLIAPTLLLIEVVASLSRLQEPNDLSKRVAAQLNKSQEIVFASLDSSLVQTAIDVAADLQLRAADATYVALAYQRGLPLVSWDKEQLQRASSIIKTHSPVTYPF